MHMQMVLRVYILQNLSTSFIFACGYLANKERGWDTFASGYIILFSVYAVTSSFRIKTVHIFY
jgi:hypothetical protein